jgi:hypothetical protein
MPAFFTDSSPNMTVVSIASLSRVLPGYFRQQHFTDRHHDWAVRVVQRGLHSAYPRVKYQAARLLFILIYNRPEFAFSMLRTPTLMTALLTLEADLPIHHYREEHVILHVARLIHLLESQSSVKAPSRLIPLLASLLDHDRFYVRQAAAKTFASLASTLFLPELVKHLTHKPSCPHSATATPQPPDPAFALGIQFAINNLEGELYGSADDSFQHNPGMLFSLFMEPECWLVDDVVVELHDIYTSLYQMCAPLVTLYANTPCELTLCRFLRQLRTVVRHYQHQVVPSEPGDDLQLPQVDDLLMRQL